MSIDKLIEAFLLGEMRSAHTMAARYQHGSPLQTTWSEKAEKIREATNLLASTQAEILRLNKDLMFANAQLADMEFLSVAGFISWKSDRAGRPRSQDGEEGA